MQTNFSPTQLADPDIAVADKILRACVHCGFCQATCPTYVLLGDELEFAPRAHLPDQGDAGARCACDCRGGDAYRPLPLVPRLHDDMPFRRALHASGRSCPRAYRGNLYAAIAGPADAAIPGPCHAVSAQTSHGDDSRRTRQALRPVARRHWVEAARGGGTSRAAPPAGRHDRAGRLSGGRLTQGEGGAACRLRQRGAVAVDHRRDHPPAQPPRRRGRDCARGGLLRLARAPPRPGRGRLRQGAL